MPVSHQLVPVMQCDDVLLTLEVQVAIMSTGAPGCTVRHQIQASAASGENCDGQEA